MPASADLTEQVAGALAELRDLGGAQGLHTAALAVDPHHWRLMTFSLWEREAPRQAETEHYEVLHLSAPGLASLPRGRAW